MSPEDLATFLAGEVRTYVQRAVGQATAEFTDRLKDLATPVPGPAGGPGPQGPPGPAGRDGLSLEDLKAAAADQVTAQLPDLVTKAVADILAGVPLMVYKGVWHPEGAYQPGHTVTFGGSLWHCNAATQDKPGTNDSWTLAAKRGRDGRDGKG